MKPDVKTVAITRADGGVTVLRVIENEYDSQGFLRMHYEITAEYVNDLIAKYEWQGGLAPTSWEFVPNDYVHETTDRTYRNAWIHSGKGKPDHDMPKAREIHRVYLRKARMMEFCRLDEDYRKVDEAGDAEAKKTIGAERQKYRDVTEHPRIEAAQTVEELKALTLKELIPEAQGIRYTDKLRVSPSIKEVK